MIIDGNELAILQDRLEKEGRHQEAWDVKQEFLRPESCPHHGNCFECVTLHRGHRDHLPMCMWDMVNERLYLLSHMTEGTLQRYEKAHTEEEKKQDA